ncbi:hypothetical protein Dda_0833 [Drechslerella dactyloides]|uniref:N-acetyltransferase domain-containing protein n=1 Tax=Drechslerella dactyloides TaxID=74499 RepID=A0AAD6NN00_DREDA|nr:hypothetical protein Dda_0833 [Drechslerella dactyloides]
MEDYYEVYKKLPLPDPKPTATTTAVPLPTVTHAPPRFEYISSEGHHAQWVLFVLMLLSTIAFIALSWKIAIPKRILYQLITYVTLISTIGYYVTVTGGGWSFNPVWAAEGHKHDIPDTHQLVLRQVFWARYVDWLVTTPMLLFALGALSGLSGSNILNTIVANVTMNLTGLFGAYTSRGKYKPGWYVMSWLAFLAVAWNLVGNARATAQRRGVQKVYNPLAIYTIAVWTGYLIIWGVSDLSRKLSPDGEVIAYGILDILAKPIFGLWLLFSYRKSSDAEVHVDGAWAEGFGQREGLLRVGDSLDDQALAAALSAEIAASSRKRKRTPIPNNTPPPPPIKHAFFKDRVTPNTVFPVPPGFALPETLILKLCSEFNRELERGTSFPFTEPMSLHQFQAYWFSNHAAVMVQGKEDALLRDGRDWDADCVGSFLVIPRYPGRSSHICTGQFLICENFRRKGAGKVLISAFMEYATKLGYSSALFDLIYETNEPMLSILDSLGFKRIGVLKSAGNLLNSSEPVDSIILSRDLADEEDYQANERFEKIRYYLDKGKYPPGATRSEKSRLRSAATHYRLVGEKLMLKGKEVISDPQKQFEISREMHRVSHGGINKTTAQIADKYHWIQIKKTVGQVLRSCLECTQNARPPVVKASTPTDKSRDGESGDNPVAPTGAATSSARAARSHISNAEDDQNDSADADAEIDDESVIPLSTVSQPDQMLDVSPPPPHNRAHSQSAISDHPHRAVKSPPGLHHHQLAQSIRSQHDAMSLSQRAQAAAMVESALPGIAVLATPGLAENLPVDQAIVDEVVRHMHAIHQQHQHSGPDNDSMDDINILPSFDDIQQFDESDLQLIGSPRSDSVAVTMDEAERRRQARETALMAVAAIRSASAGVPAGQSGEEGDPDVILETFD